MKELNEFYKLAEDDANKNVFDLDILKESIYIDPPITIISRKSFNSPQQINEFGGGHRKTNKQDYDDSFCRKIYSLRPNYIVNDLLEYHYNYYKTLNENSKIFLNHIEYEILRKIGNPELKEIITKWLKNNNTMILEKQQREKNLFLLTAYEAACEFSPSSPLSVNINPMSVGEVIGISEADTKRIMAELVQQGFANSGAGYKMLLITSLGLQYLKEVNLKKDSGQITITANDYSNVQIQTNPVNSSQTQNITSNNDLSQIIKDIKANLDELKKYLSTGEHEDLTTDLNELEKNLEQGKPNRAKRFLSGVWETLKTVPKEVLMKILTEPNYLQSIENALK